MMKRTKGTQVQLEHIDRIHEEEFVSMEELNEWVHTRVFNVKPINIQKIGDEGYLLFYGKLIE